jgi:hypothetical protein
MMDQYVTDHFPTAIAPKEAWPDYANRRSYGSPRRVLCVEPHAESGLVAHLLQSLASFGAPSVEGLIGRMRPALHGARPRLAGDTGLGHLCRS